MPKMYQIVKLIFANSASEALSKEQESQIVSVSMNEDYSEEDYNNFKKTKNAARRISNGGI